MHKHLSCSLSRLSSLESAAIVRVLECLPGLHPIHLHSFGAWMIDVPTIALMSVTRELRPHFVPFT
jgi:hypothetical protein